ncbi:superoxide dismutase [Azospirillum sp. B21]|uniref:Fe-Mn family superoxide dismutase n=1 Tax=Azospirillum sp. B21 TaxID=2607496 RepID=UPI0011EC0DE1|nr:Fe-Mn family superoxide dismutase [Azospirillum sp. B21]KAA0572679.1 superoxide dismutase [Azospirillum sp. B21]
MPHEVAPLPFKPPRLTGLSERLLASHYENNYGGAVRRLNAIEADLARLDWSAAPTFVINGLKREELIAANSMILHEAYFDSLGGSGDAGGELAAALERDFGSVARWRREFTAMGKALGGGSGWVLLTLSERDGRLRNVWAADHGHTPADGRVVLALDMYEHAYHLDFGAKAGAYVNAFMANIAWERVADRHRRAAEGFRTASQPADAVPEMSVGEARRAIESGELLVLDVCWAEDLAKSSDMLPTAVHHDARRIEEWADGVPKDREVLAYCVYGFQVSRDAVTELRRRGVSARTLAGGIAAWRAMAAPTVPKA